MNVSLQPRLCADYGLQTILKVIGGSLATVKPRNQEHSKIRTCILILWQNSPNNKNQKQTDLFQCSHEMVHLITKFYHINEKNSQVLTNEHL